MSSTVDLDQWISQVQDDFPDTPNRLTLEVEEEELKRLTDWKERLEALRSEYEDKGDEALPHWLRGMPGGSLTKPVLWSATSMSDEEKEAWHRLFSCVVGQMADIALDYWNSQEESRGSAVSVADVLDYLPVVFLYVLGSYDEHYGYESHDEDFSKDDDRVRLTTWVGIETPKHIRVYMRTIGYVLDRGSQTIHRVRAAVRKAQQKIQEEKERQARKDEIVDYVSEETGYGSRVSKGTVEKRVRDVAASRHVVSTEKPVGGDEDEGESRTIGQQIADSPSSTGHHVDIYTYLRDRVSDSAKRHACLKLLDTEEDLDVNEQFWF